MKQLRNSSRYSILLFFFVSSFFLVNQTLNAQTLNQKLKALSPGMSAAEVLSEVGEPKEKIILQRWFYEQQNQVVVSEGYITDIRLNPELKDKSIRFSGKHNKNIPGDEVRLLRIGMQADSFGDSRATSSHSRRRRLDL